MSRSMDRRKSSLKGISTFKEPSGSILTFQWSISAAKFHLLQDRSSPILPSIDGGRSKRKLFADFASSGGKRMTDMSPNTSDVRNSFLSDSNSASQSSTSTQTTSPSPRTTKKSQSRMFTHQEKTSNDTHRSPLLLTYTQLHHIPVDLPTNRPTRARLSIHPLLSDKRSDISVVSSERSMRSLSPATSVSLSSTVIERRLPSDTLIRLRTPQLRRLNVSEKYFDDAKKLYFNADCRSFIPRLSIAQVA